jgi:hypothetical protein
MMPDYLTAVIALAAIAYTVRSIVDTYFMIKDYQEIKK